MQVRIYQPSKSAMQSGRGKTMIGFSNTKSRRHGARSP